MKIILSISILFVLLVSGYLYIHLSLEKHESAEVTLLSAVDTSFVQSELKGGDKVCVKGVGEITVHETLFPLAFKGFNPNDDIPISGYRYTDLISCE